MRDVIRKEIGGHEIIFDPGNSLLCVRFNGRVTYESLREFAEELYEDPDYNQNWDVLIEMGSADFDVSFLDLFHYADHIAKDPRRVLGATALVSPSLLHYGIGRMYSGIVGDRLGKLWIERTREPALAWLRAQRAAPPDD